jgi:hypothetical protein
VIDASLIPRIIGFVQAADPAIKREALTCIANATGNCTKEQMTYLVAMDVINACCQALNGGINAEKRIVTPALEGLANVSYWFTVIFLILCAYFVLFSYFINSF